MLLGLNALERTRDEFNRVVEASGFKIENVFVVRGTPAGSMYIPLLHLVSTHDVLV